MNIRVNAAAPLAGVAWAATPATGETGRLSLVVLGKLVWQLAGDGGISLCSAELPGTHRSRPSPEELDPSPQPRLVVRGYRACSGQVQLRRESSYAAELSCAPGNELAQLPLSGQNTGANAWLVTTGMDVAVARRWCKIPNMIASASVGGSERWPLAQTAYVLCVESWTLSLLLRLELPCTMASVPSVVELAVSLAPQPANAPPQGFAVGLAAGAVHPPRDHDGALPFEWRSDASPVHAPDPAPAGTKHVDDERGGRPTQEFEFADEGTVAADDIGSAAMLPFLPFDVVPPSRAIRDEASEPLPSSHDANRAATPFAKAAGSVPQAPPAFVPLPPQPDADIPSGEAALLAEVPPAVHSGAEEVAQRSAPASSTAEPTTIAETGTRKLVLDNVRANVAMYGMDLSGADLHGLDLTGAILSDARLTGAKLNGVVLRNARLSGAKLANADLSFADLTDADLSRADLSRSNLTDATLSDANLSDATLVMARAEGARFGHVSADRAKLTQACLDGASLVGAKLRDADLSGASLARASFVDAVLTGARLSDATGEGAVLSGAILDGAICVGVALVGAQLDRIEADRTSWERADLTNARFDDARMRDASFAKAKVDGASFLRVDLVRSDLSAISGDGADFSHANLTSTELRMSKLRGARFDEACLVDVNAQKIIAPGASFAKANLRRATLRGSKLKDCNLTDAQLDDCDLRDTDLENATVAGADLTRAKTGGAVLRGVLR